MTQKTQEQLPDDTEPFDLNMEEQGIDASSYGGKTPASRNYPNQKPLEAHARQVVGRKSAAPSQPAKRKQPLQKRQPQIEAKKRQPGLSVSDPSELELIARFRSQKRKAFEDRQAEMMRPRRPDVVETDPGWESTGSVVADPVEDADEPISILRPARRPLTSQARAPPSEMPEGLDEEEARAIEQIRKRRMTQAEVHQNAPKEKRTMVDGIAGILYLLGGSFAGIASTAAKPIASGDALLYAGIGAAAVAGGFVFQNFLGPKLR